MSLRVCDYEPCENLQQAIQKLVVVPNQMQEFNLVVVSKGRPVRTFFFPLTYCPFCGTRIEDEWVESFLSHSPLRSSRAKKEE